MKKLRRKTVRPVRQRGALAVPSCKLCQAPMQRVPRRFGDRVISLFVPVLRYRCTDVDCGFESLLRRRAPVAAPGPAPPYVPAQFLDASRNSGER